MHDNNCTTLFALLSLRVSLFCASRILGASTSGRDEREERCIRMHKLVMILMQCLILSVSLTANLSAQQVITGTIAGTITDPDGRAVPSIPVQAANMATKIVYRTTASATGEYSIA